MTGLIVVILLVVLVALYPIVRDFVRRRRSVTPAYVEGLQLVIDGRLDDAAARLKEAVHLDPNNIDAWLRLGDVLIRQGATERGMQVHENLALRRNLKPQDETQVLRALARDYVAADRKLKAVSTLEELVRLGRVDRWTAESLFRLYLDTSSLDKCEQLLAEFKPGTEERGWVALLTAELGRALSADAPDKAEKQFAAALKLDPASLEARLYQGDHQLARGDTGAAIATWTALIEQDPTRNPLVRERLEAAYYESGRYDDVGRLYEGLLRKVPGDEGLLVALARLYQKKEDHQSAVRLLERHYDPATHRQAGTALAFSYLRLGRADDAERVLAALGDEGEQTEH